MVFLYAEGRLTRAPSTTRGFKSLAHDIVRWWDSDPEKSSLTRRGSELRLHIMDALAARGGGPLRAIRPSTAREIDQTVSFDDVLTVLISGEAASGRMARVDRLLRQYARAGMIPEPLVDVPSALHWCRVYADDGAPRGSAFSRTESASVLFGADADRKTVVSEFRAETLAILDRGDRGDRGDRPSSELCVFANARQAEYVQTILGGRSAFDRAVGSRPRMYVREFARKERLPAAMPLVVAAQRLGLETDGNLASLMERVCDRLEVLDLLVGMRDVCRMPMQDVVDRATRYRCSRLVSDLGARAELRRDTSERPSAQNLVQGGHVIDPSRTYVPSAMAVVDFASLYPSIIVSGCVEGTADLTAVVRELMRRRRAPDTPRAVARACKVLANSFYGQIASPTSPVFDPDVANAITATGRDRLADLVKHLQARGGDVVYGDTDSCMVTFAGRDDTDSCRDEAEACAAEFNARLPPPMRVEVQDVFERSVMLTKKKYVGARESGTLQFTGTLNVRSDTPPIVASRFEAVAAIALEPGTTPRDLADEVRTLARSSRRVAGARVGRGPDVRTNRRGGLQVIDAHAAIQAASGPELVMARRLSSLDGDQACCELARCESMREDGDAYEASDSIEFVACAERSVVSVWTLDGFEEAVQSGRAIDLHWRTHWRTFLRSCLSLAGARFGEDEKERVAGWIAAATEPPPKSAGPTPRFTE